MKLSNEERARLEKLADVGILPSALGIGDKGDTSAKYMKQGVDIDDDNVIMFYDESGGIEKFIYKPSSS